MTSPLPSPEMHSPPPRRDGGAASASLSSNSSLGLSLSLSSSLRGTPCSRSRGSGVRRASSLAWTHAVARRGAHVASLLAHSSDTHSARSSTSEPRKELSRRAMLRGQRGPRKRGEREGCVRGAIERFYRRIELLTEEVDHIALVHGHELRHERLQVQHGLLPTLQPVLVESRPVADLVLQLRVALLHQ
jgi:hypothetical protein